MEFRYIDILIYVVLFHALVVYKNKVRIKIINSTFYYSGMEELDPPSARETQS